MHRDELNQRVFEQNRAMHRMWHMYYRSQNSGISIAQLGILMKINHLQPVSGGLIAEHLQISRSAVTQLLDGLFAAGYITRTEDLKDRRVTFLSLSEKGKQFMADLERMGKAFFSEVSEVLTDEELAQMADIQGKILSSLEARLSAK
jgi:DNA-binding MarR family transcriptional regulator